MIDEMTKDYQTLVHFVPTVKQRAAFVRSGAAMPDGSFYIRNPSDLNNAILAVGRATPNNNESETARRNSVRRHIIERAKQMNLSSRIPDTWNANGSLKQSALVADVDAVIAHFGRKGMHWGEHIFGGPDSGGSSKPSHAERKAAKKTGKAQTQRDRLLEEAKQHDQLAKGHDAVAQQVQKDAQDLIVNRERSALFKANFGKNSDTETELHFRLRTGMSKSVAASTLHGNALTQSGQFARSAENHRQAAIRKRAKAELLKQQHALHAMPAEDFIAHFGRKGMKWGAHIFGRDRGGSSSPVHADAAKAHESLNIAKKHGTSALSTHDLKNLNTRLQQEQQFRNLTEHRKSEGQKAVESYLRQQALQQGPKLILKYGPKGAAWVAKNVIGSGKHAK